LTPSHLAIGWVLSKQPSFVPTLGMRKLEQLDEALTSSPLTAEQVAEVEATARRDRGRPLPSRTPGRAR
jgi:aryl-alcohol dehydrogenase-like predicted oxidoreductase